MPWGVHGGVAIQVFSLLVPTCHSRKESALGNVVNCIFPSSPPRRNVTPAKERHPREGTSPPRRNVTPAKAGAGIQNPHHPSFPRIFPSFPRRREFRIRTNSVVFGPKFIRIPTLAGMTADLTTPPSGCGGGNQLGCDMVAGPFHSLVIPASRHSRLPSFPRRRESI